MPRKFFNPNPFPTPYGLKPSVMQLGSKTIPSLTPFTPKSLHTKPTSVKLHPLPLLCSISSAAKHLPIYKGLTKLSLVNVQLTAYMLALLKRKEHICSITMSVGNCLNPGMLNLKRLKDEN